MSSSGPVKIPVGAWYASFHFLANLALNDLLFSVLPLFSLWRLLVTRSYLGKPKS